MNYLVAEIIDSPLSNWRMQVLQNLHLADKVPDQNQVKQKRQRDDNSFIINGMSNKGKNKIKIKRAVE